MISTWRAGASDKLHESKQIIDLKCSLEKKGIDIFGYTPLSGKSRQLEIEYYIRRNKVKDYIVLDDDISLFENPENINLYVPDFKKGFTKNDIKKAVKMLRKRRWEH